MDDPVLEDAFIPDRYVARVLPAGGAGVDAFVLSVFACALMGFANIYYGLAKRALDKSISAVKGKRSLALPSLRGCDRYVSKDNLPGFTALEVNWSG